MFLVHCAYVEIMNSAQKVGNLLQNLEHLFVEGQNSDIILKVGDHEIPAHKGILGVHSPVFASMFKYDTAEKNNNVVIIPDCSPEAFEIFVRFLYTRNITLSNETVFDVYYIADKYCVDDLKDHIIEYLKDNLSQENCCQVFSVALRHSDLELQKLVTTFFCDNLLNVISTPQWRDFLHDQHLEANELLKSTLHRLKQSNVLNCSSIRNQK